MSNQEIHDPLDFSQDLRLLETTDLAHADTFNPLFARLINNESFLKAAADALALEISEYQADYVRQPGYAVDTGTVNHLIVTLNPAPTSYVDGMGIAVKVANPNTGAVNINSNNLGVKLLKNPDGTDLASGDLVVGGIYSLKYNSTSGNFILVGKGGGPNKVGSNTVLTPSTVDQAFPKGYYGGALTDGKVKGDANLIGSNLLANIFGVTATGQAKNNLLTYIKNMPSGYQSATYIEGEGLWCLRTTSPDNKAYLLNSSGTIINTVTCTTNTNTRLVAVGKDKILWSYYGGGVTHITDKSGNLLRQLSNSLYKPGVGGFNSQRVFFFDGALGHTILYDFLWTKIAEISGGYQGCLIFPCNGGCVMLNGAGSGSLSAYLFFDDGAELISNSPYLYSALGFSLAI